MGEWNALTQCSTPWENEMHWQIKMQIDSDNLCLWQPSVPRVSDIMEYVQPVSLMHWVTQAISSSSQYSENIHLTTAGGHALLVAVTYGTVCRTTSHQHQCLPSYRDISNLSISHSQCTWLGTHHSQWSNKSYTPDRNEWLQRNTT